MDNLKITFYLSSPVCLTFPFLHFDAIIMHLLYRKTLGERYRLLPTKAVVKIDVEEVLDKYKDVYRASAAVFDYNEPQAIRIYKKFCEKYLDYNKIKRKRIERGKGKFRDFMLQYVYLPCKTAVFYVRGDYEKIDELLKCLPALGQKRSIGFGFIKDYEIKKISKDYSLVKDNVAMRAIPVEYLKHAEEVTLLPYKPPYWDSRNVKLCCIPFTHVRL